MCIRTIRKRLNQNRYTALILVGYDGREYAACSFAEENTEAEILDKQKDIRSRGQMMRSDNLKGLKSNSSKEIQSMKYRIHQRTGDRISEIGMGSAYLYEAKREEAVRALRTAYEGGINYFDLAAGHGKAFSLWGDALGDVTKANEVLGWKSETPTDDVLRSAWRWQQKLREDGIQ